MTLAIVARGWLACLATACGGAQVTPSHAAHAQASVAHQVDAAPPPPKWNAEELSARAREALDAHDPDHAAALARDAIAADAKDHPDAYVVLGELALARHDAASALSQLDQALRLDPADGWATTLAAEALSQLGRKDEARQRLRAFSVAHPDTDPDVLDALGWSEHEAKDVARARAAFEAANRASGGEDAEAHLGLATLAADGGDVTTAGRELRIVLVLDPSRWQALKDDESFEEVRTAPGVRDLFTKAPPPVPPSLGPTKSRRTEIVARLATPSAERAEPPERPEPAESNGQMRPDEREIEPVPRPAVDIDGEQLARVTYAGARLEVSPIAKLGIFPKVEMLRVGAADASYQDSLRGYVGGGAVVRPFGTWSLEGSGLYGPVSQDVETTNGALSSNLELGAPDEKAGHVEGDVAFEVTHFRWVDGQGPAGADLTQFYGELRVLVRATARLYVAPHMMYFLYDRSLANAVGSRLGTVVELARVGAFAPPLALAGGRIGYDVVRWLGPFVEAEQIFYAFGSGDAQLVDVGAKLTLKALVLKLSGGMLFNQVSGPLIPPGSSGVLPVGTMELHLEY